MKVHATAVNNYVSDIKIVDIDVISGSALTSMKGMMQSSRLSFVHGQKRTESGLVSDR